MDAKTRKHILSLIPYGLYIIGAAGKDGPHAIVANWLTQVSFHPPMVAISIEQDSVMRRYLSKNGHFTLNLIRKGGKDQAKAFLKPTSVSGSMINGEEFLLTNQGTPYLANAMAHLECTVTDQHLAGDHVIFVGEVTGGKLNEKGGTEILTLHETGWKYSR